MRANEFRIGNHVLARCEDDKEHFEKTVVTGIFEDEIHHEAVGMTNPTWRNEIKNIKPIETTKELLLMFGFEDGVGEMALYTDEFCVFWRKYENHFEINGEKYFFKEFHKIQNLIFAMTGFELLIK